MHWLVVDSLTLIPCVDGFTVKQIPIPTHNNRDESIQSQHAMRNRYNWILSIFLPVAIVQQLDVVEIKQ